MKLYLTQHGQALGKEVDPARPLSEQGERDVKAMAAFLQGAGTMVSRVVHSGKRRAEQTAAILVATAMRGGPQTAISGINPKDAVEDFAAVIAGWQEDTLVVGHLPFMARLVSLLLAGDPKQELISFYPGSIACLERQESGHWILLWMIRPDVLAGRPTA